MEGKGKKRKAATRGELVTQAMKKRIKSLRLSANLSVQELAGKAEVSDKTLKKIESPRSLQRRFDPDTLIKLAKALGTTLTELKQDGRTQHTVATSLCSFEYLAEQLRDIDQKLLLLIRDHRHTPQHVIEEGYYDLLHRHLQKKKISLEKLDQQLHDRQVQESFVNELPKPSLTVDVSDNLDCISYTCSPEKQIHVTRPQLFWDCHCDTPSSKSGKFKCPIHSSPFGDEVYARFSSGYVLIKYGRWKFYWRSGQELWPPSIDSFYMLQDLEKDGFFAKTYRNVLDLGSGTGFLGIVAASRNPYIRQLVLSDWLLTPYLYGTANWLLNNMNREHVTYKGRVGLCTSSLDVQAKPYDVVICNPPYLPLLKGFDELGLESTVAGTDLLRHVILKNRSLGNRIYIQFSHLASPEARTAQEIAGVKLRPIGREHIVPFRLRILRDRQDYLDLLIRERGLIVKNNTRHPYWHRIQTHVLE